MQGVVIVMVSVRVGEDEENGLLMSMLSPLLNR